MIEDEIMKILFVINQLGGGGAERVLILLANYLARNSDYDVTILSIHKSKQKYEISSNLSVTECDGFEENTVKIIKAIRKKIQQVKPEIVVSFEYHMNMKVILAAFAISKTRLIISERNDPATKGGKFPLKQIRNVLYQYAECLVCQTPDAKAYFPKDIRRKSVVIPNPIKEDLPGPFAGKRKKTIVNFCRMEPQKNLFLLIDAFDDFRKKHSEYTLEIYGDGTLGNDLKAYVDEKMLYDYISIHPAIPDIHEKIIDAGMFVSSSDYEGLSNSMLEAMALGIPTICTDCPCGGARMMIEDGVNGLLVPVKNKSELSNAMEKIANDPELALRIGTEATSIRNKLNITTIVNMWLQAMSIKT